MIRHLRRCYYKFAVDVLAQIADAVADDYAGTAVAPVADAVALMIPMVRHLCCCH